jgi:multiple sugar transport system permease protein
MYKIKKKHINTLFYLILLILGSVVIMIPLMWTLSTALKSPKEVFLNNFLPEKLLWSNFSRAVKAVPFGLYFMNTMTILVPVMIGTIASAAIVAYGFARLKVPCKNLLFMILISTMLIPGEVTLIPKFIMFRSLGWVNSFKPLIIPAFFGHPFNIFLLRQYIAGIPYEYDEAAIIDGASKFRIFYSIIMPLTKPALTAISIFTITGVWNDFQGPLIYLNDMNKYTLAIGITQFKGMYNIEWNMMMAATILILLPIVALFFILQKQFIEGIAITGLKG